MLARAALLLLATLVACAPPPDDSGGEGEGEGEGERPDFTALDAAIAADLELSLATGAQAAVWINDSIFVVGSYGTRDPLTDAPVTAATQFCIGSDTKKITALAALLRVDDGSLALDTTIQDVLPDLTMPYALALQGATLHELLSHQGGMNDWTDLGTETTDAELRSVTYGAFASEVYSMAPPGVFFNYANPNFSLAGLLVEEVSGAPFADVLEDELFEPLGMADTVARKASVGPEGAGGTGFNVAGAGPIALGFVDMWETAFTRPAGMVWSTAEDQARLARFLVEGDGAVLDDALREEVSTGHAPLYPDLPGAYGYGLAVERGISIGDAYYDVPYWQHGGNTLAHTSMTFILPEQRFAISILSNGSGDDFTGSLVAAITSLVTLPAPSTPDDPPMPDAASLLALEGLYVDPFNVGDLTVTSTGSTLSISMPLVDDAGIPYEPLMTPISARVFVANIQDFETLVSFFDGPNGEVYFATRYFVAVRPDAQARTFTADAQPERLRRALLNRTPRTRLHELIGPAGFMGGR